MIDFWMRMGVDGVRLDAVPYLFEREGTNCENLPETHEFLKNYGHTWIVPTKTGYCSPRPISGLKMPPPTSATATRATWPFTFR